MTSRTAGNASQTPGSRQWWGLVVLVLPGLMLFMMATILFVATPRLAVDLEASGTQTLWILDIYGLTMAGFLIAMGTLADRIGRRRVLMIGAAVFGIVAILAASTSDPNLMIVLRGVSGVAAAAQMPATLGLIFVMFPNPTQRGVAVGAWAAAISAGVAVGPLVGGLLLEVSSWRAAFLIAVPVAAIVLVAAPLLLPEHRDPNAGRPDLLSALLLFGTLVAPIHGIKALAKGEPVSLAIVTVAAGALFGAWFTIRQTHLPTPLLDLRLLAKPTVRAALAVFTLATAAVGGVYHLATQYLQLVAGLSPLRTGQAILPAALLLMLVSMTSPLLTRRVRPGTIIAVGLVLQVVGYLTLTQVEATAGATLLIAGFVVLYPAVAPTMALATDLIVSSVPRDKAGAAAGLATTASALGISLGVALIGSLSIATYRHEIRDTLPSQLSTTQAAAARESISGAHATSGDLSGTAGQALLEVARSAFTSGLNLGAATAAGIAAVASILATLRLRPKPPTQCGRDRAGEVERGAH